eukprot:scaffold97400_cov79-Phaeocystis_antarctica.AAC.1
MGTVGERRAALHGRTGGHRNRGHRGVPPRLRTVHQANGRRTAERAVRWPRLARVRLRWHQGDGSNGRGQCRVPGD